MTPKLPVIGAKEIIRALERAGFYFHYQTGSHITMKHQDGRRTTVAFHIGDMKRGTIRAILRETNISIEDFIDLL